MFPITVPASFSIVAHRGASAYAPENTMAAFELARRMGAAEIEFDTQLAADRVVVVCHDESLERFGYPGVRIVETPSARLTRLDMGSHFSPFLHSAARMPALETVLDAFGAELTYHVELKGPTPHLCAEVHDHLKGRGLIDHSIVSSFTPELLARMRDISPDVRLAWLVDSLDDRTLAQARELDLFQLNPRARTVTPENVAAAHEIVEEVQPWELLGTPPEVAGLIRRLVECSCDGMTINWPDWAVHGPA